MSRLSWDGDEALLSKSIESSVIVVFDLCGSVVNVFGAFKILYFSIASAGPLICECSLEEYGPYDGSYRASVSQQLCFIPRRERDNSKNMLFRVRPPLSS